MKQRIIINADTYETRVAILELDELAELFVERAELGATSATCTRRG